VPHILDPCILSTLNQVRDFRAQNLADAEDDGFEVVEGWGKSSRDDKRKPQRVTGETITRGSRLGRAIHDVCDV
jgi:hypothetical protein